MAWAYAGPTRGDDACAISPAHSSRAIPQNVFRQSATAGLEALDAQVRSCFPDWSRTDRSGEIRYRPPRAGSAPATTVTLWRMHQHTRIRMSEDPGQ